MRRQPGRKVKPLSKIAIRQIAQIWRDHLELTQLNINPKVVIELLLPRVWSDFSFEVRDRSEMPASDGYAYPDRAHLEIPSDVYDSGHEGEHKFTLAHELGHLALHTGQMSYARSGPPRKLYEDSEWQADQFAAEFLMPYDAVLRMQSADEVQRVFRVSASAARVRFEKVKEEGRSK